MDIDFHYYGTMYAALLAGYEENDAIEIAEAAQFVDEFTQHQFPKSFGLKTSEKCCYTSYDFDTTGKIDQGTSWSNTLAKKWVPFHFAPRMSVDTNIIIGDQTYASNITNSNDLKMITAPNGEIFNSIINAKLNDNVEIGLKMHVLADMYAHQGFVGYRYKNINCINNKIQLETIDSRNKKYFKEKSITSSYVYFAAIGHADCGHYPDYGYAVYKYKPYWNNEKIEVLRNNPQIFYDAFFMMYKTLINVKARSNEESEEAKIADTILQKLENVKNMLETKDEKREFQNDLWKNLIVNDFKIDNVCDIISIDSPKKSNSKTVCDIYKKEYNDNSNKNSTKLSRFELAAKKHYDMVNSISNFEKV